MRAETRRRTPTGSWAAESDRARLPRPYAAGQSQTNVPAVTSV